MSANLLTNGGFETLAGGFPASWSNAVAGHVESVTVHEGARAVRMQSGNAALLTQGWVGVTPGAEYVLTGWFKGDAFSGDGWGQLKFSVTNSDWEQLAAYSIGELAGFVGSGDWHKLAVGFTADTAGVQVSVGVFGPKDIVDIYFDDIRLLEKSGNQAPTLAPTGSLGLGAAPLSVQYSANADDPDGAVQYYVWSMGDGSEYREANPLHVFIEAGTFSPVLTVYDNDGAASSASLPVVTVNDGASPVLSIDSPTATGEYVTADASVTLGGTASVAASGGSVLESLAWDNLRTGLSGYVAASVAWSLPDIGLAPGRNEILLTVTDAAGHVGTDRIVVERSLGAPVISGAARVGGGEVPLYGLWEARFDLETVAEDFLFDYDVSPPSGIEPETGLRAEGRFTAPNGAVLTQPAYWHPFVERGADGQFRETGAGGEWRLRFTPRQRGTWQAALHVTDRSGSASHDFGNFEVIASGNKGFVRVSEGDPRYFTHDNGDLFFPLGPAMVEDMAANSGTLDLVRPWMGGYGAYSSNWARWVSSSEQHGNEGYQSPLTFMQHYPGHDLSYHMVVDGTEPEGDWLWFGRLWTDSRPEIDPGKTYRLRLRCRMSGLTAADAGQPFGLAGMVHGWTPSGTEWVDYLSGIPDGERAFGPVAARRGWHSIVTDFSVGADREYFSLLLQNVAVGEVYIDALSIREIDGAENIVGGEQIRNARADLHRYVDSRGAAALEYQVQQGMANVVYYKYVVQDKNDWVPGHLTRHGFFHDSGHGYYQEPGTRTHWQQRQWWRYLAARWGAFPAVQSWELNNEGAPTSESHWRATQEFAAFFEATGGHPSLASTSFWSSWVPEFWSDSLNYPDVDYADIHQYTKGDVAGRDLAGWFLALADQVQADEVGKPVMLAEHGVSVDTADGQLLSMTPNPGIWYHNLLWAQLHPAGMTAFNYWFSEHFRQVDLYYFGEDRGGVSRVALAGPFRDFVGRLDLHEGGYADAEAEASAGLRVMGQKNGERGVAHLWIQNASHTWHAAMTAPGSIAAVSGTVSLTLDADTRYWVKWWDCWEGGVVQIEELRSGLDGLLILPVDGLYKDIAVLIEAEEPTASSSWETYAKQGSPVDR